METRQRIVHPGFAPAADLPARPAVRRSAIRDLLAAWRSAERQMDGTPDGGPERAQLQGQIAGLRRAYQDLFQQIRRGSSAD